ncbi:MAG: hypothetical protein JWL93_1394 [Hyphomicrobiales bacterium]|jgi:uncharacterized protein YcfJ|nr:hypothetical protein [Hyphomicrobiales bacterium]
MRTFIITAVSALTVISGAAMAQEGGAAAGAATGAVGGAIVGGPVGAVVGGAAGAVVGGLASDDERRFREYTVREKRPSYTYREDLRVGATLPERGVTYYDVPSEYKVSKYKYTIVNDRPVLVDPGSRRVIQVID